LKTPDQKLVGNALSQRRLRTDNGEVNPIFFGCPDQPLNISRADINVPGELSRAGIARSDVYFFDPTALGELPDQGMLPAPAADNQYLYLPHPLNPPLLSRRGGRVFKRGFASL
jgi:hypothetical protein